MRGMLLLFAVLGFACGDESTGGPLDGGTGTGTTTTTGTGTGTGGGCTGASCPNVIGSVECNAYCSNILNACGPGTNCNETFFCRIRTGECAASTRARLACSAMNMPNCFEGGWSIGGCSSDNSVCGDGG